MLFLLFFLGGLRLHCAAEHELLKLVLYRKNRAALHHLFDLRLKAEGLVKLNGELDDRKRGHAGADKIFGNIKFVVSDNLFHDLRNFLFEEGKLPRCGIFLLGGVRLDFGKLAPVELTVYIQRDCVDLHCGGRHHVWRLVFQNEIIELLNVNFTVGNDVCVNALSAALKSLGNNCTVGDSVVIADNFINLGKLDTEASDFYLTVISADVVNIAVIGKADDIARVIKSFVALFVAVGVLFVNLRGLLGTVKISS